MAEALFYQLSHRPLEAALPELLEKTLARGWRAVVRVGGEARLEALNRLLWTYRDDSFLPHGGPDDGAPERQPIYLTTGDETPNAPDLLFLVDGAEAATEEIARYVRVCRLFDDGDPQSLAAARAAWRAVSDAGLSAAFWAQEPGGKWVKKAETAGAKD